ncbi:MAG TPA: hypothetical protein VK424_05455 [Thermoplasmata archaeon]|nr:hypothetical protein [Thermoplasmata archaeon]
MAASEVGAPAAHAPIAVVWCRQVDNEAESPGYTTIPDEFPGRRETLEAIRVVGNLTVNVADTHDYWDPDPSAPLSYYPNLFLYPAAAGRYTCVGRMFLSTEDRPRIGMKTLVFETAALAASGEFGAAVLRAHATMGGRSGGDRPAADPDQSIYQGVGEGFLYHRGSTEPVVLVTAEQWEATNQVVLDLVRELPTALVALGAFLVFPYFLPVAKVDMHQFTEQLPLALAVMRVPRGEAQGDRHMKRIQGWEGAPVTLRDLTRPPTGRAAKDALPLVLQYARDHAEDKLGEVSHRVDLVEAARMKAIQDDADRQGGRDRRKEMWRIGTAMETAALLLARPRGRSVSVTGEAAKRANEYVKVKRDTDRGGGGGPAPPSASAALPQLTEPAATQQLPPWLQRPADITLPPEGPVAVPVSIQSDPSLLSRPAADLPLPPPPPPSTSGTPSSPASLAAPPPTPVDGAVIDARVHAALGAAETKWRSTLDLKVRETADSQTRAWNESQTEVARRIESLERRPTMSPDEVARRLSALEARPSLSPDEVARRFAALESRPLVSQDEVTREAERRVREATEPRFAGVPDLVQKAVQTSGATWADSFRAELKRMADEMNARLLRGEEELRTALVAQLDLELTEAKEQGSALREEIESRVRTLVDTRFTELEQKRIRDVRDMEQRMGLLVEGRSKDLEARLRTQVDARATELDQKRGREAKDQDIRTGVLLDARAKDFEIRMSALLDARARELEARMGNQLSISRSAVEERVNQATKRLEVDREARLAELSDTHSKSLAGLQVRMQSYLDQKMREDSDRERGKYVELLARLKGEVDDALGRTIDSTRFDAAVRERVKTLMDENRAAYARSLAELEARLQSAPSPDTARLETIEAQLRDRADALTQVESKVRQDVDDLDRRVQVVTDKMLPLVRKTWVRIDEVEKLLARPEQNEARFAELRRDLGRELRRVESEIRDETAHLRRRLEASMTSQGKIWLNLVRQLSESGTGYVPSEDDLATERGRRGSRPVPADDEDLLARPRSRESPYVDYDEDPANPLDPQPTDSEPAPPRRAAPRTTRGGAQR